LAERTQEFPLQRYRSPKLLPRCHHPGSLLSLRWRGLQSLPAQHLARYWLRAPAAVLGAHAVPALAVLSARLAARESKLASVILSCPLARIQSVTPNPLLAVEPKPKLESRKRPFMRFLRPSTYNRSGQRPTPGLPQPAVLRLQAFSAS
jgi:hypothetical protein